MKKLLFFILLILSVGNIYSQKYSNFVFQFYGQEDDPAKLNYIRSLSLNEIDENLMSEINNYYEQNKVAICQELDLRDFKQFLLKFSNKATIEHEKDAAILGAVIDGANQIATNVQQQKELKRQEEIALKEQQRAMLQAMTAKNKQKYAEFQAIANRNVYSSDYHSNTSSYRTQGSYNDMLTSDASRNMAVRQSVQQYGVDLTQDAIGQANTNNVQSTLTGGYGGHVVSAVTANRQAIKIQVSNASIGGRVIAYSLGGNSVGQQQWQHTNGIISKCTSNMEYKYTAYLQGVGNIYFDM